jgi:hypothetical protein
MSAGMNAHEFTRRLSTLHTAAPEDGRTPSLSRQALQQFSVNPAEAAVAEHAHDVAALRVFRDVRND